jgi:acyl carrier protein
MPDELTAVDSVIAVTLVVDIEDRYDVALEADTLWEARTLDLLADLIIARRQGNDS